MIIKKHFNFFFLEIIIIKKTYSRSSTGMNFQDDGTSAVGVIITV